LAARFTEVDFDDATLIAAQCPSTTRISRASIHNYRWRLGLVEGEPKYEALEERLAHGGDHRAHYHP
jgi:hypothetical protein